MAALEREGYRFLESYTAIDLIHEEYGLEVCGVREYDDAQRIIDILCCTFNNWVWRSCYYDDYSLDIGWKIVVSRRSDYPGNG
jgi:hypothetical protein